MPYPTATSPRQRLSALVTHAPQRPSTPQGSGYGDVGQWARQVVEKIRAASATGHIRFLPWYDPYTEETPEIRAEYRKMLTESSVKAAFQTKILSVISLDVTVQAADDDDPRQQQAAQFGTYAFKRVKGGMRRVGWSVLHPAVIDGHSVCEKVWSPQVESSGPWRGKRIYRAVKAKDTRHLQLGIDSFRNVTGVRGIGFNNAGKIWSPDDFVIFSYLELFENPAGTSDFRAAYRPYWIKNTVWQLRSLHLDKYVGPYLKGTYTTQDQKDALESALQEARSTTWLTVPVGTLVEAIDLSMRGTTDFEQAIKDCDREILIAIVGAHLQILEGQTTGGRGNTKVHKETAELIQWFLAASLADIYREQLLAPLIAENFAGVEVPDVSVGAITEEAMLDYLKVDEGLQKLGWKLSRRDLGKRYSRPWPEPDDILEAEAAAAPGPPAGGPSPAGPASPFSEFCDEGENKGKPGPCPEHRAATLALRHAHAFPRGDDRTAYHRARIALVMDNMHGTGRVRVPLPEADAPRGKKIGRAKKAIEHVYGATADVHLLHSPAAEQVAGTHPAGTAALEGARQEAKERLAAAVANAQEHIAGLPEDQRSKAIKALKQGQVFSEDGTRQFCTEGANKGKPGPCPEKKDSNGASGDQRQELPPLGMEETRQVASEAMRHEIEEYAKLGISPALANSGDCSTVARGAVESIRQKGGKAYYGFPRVGKAHVYVIAGRKVYDIQTPEGVDSPRELPFFQDNPELLEKGTDTSEEFPLGVTCERPARHSDRSASQE